MTDAPEKLWVLPLWGTEYPQDCRVTHEKEVFENDSQEYIRKDISDARIEQLELQAVGFRESLRKAALDSEHGHEILDLCWNSYFPEMPKETNK
jgi:hypothetical protein